ncbi:MAG: hypothetical protein EA382_18570 [Spirochaetaceae bacterium]|nr:MAG: hypothetical protein EA382_18570 [Spirochaetaceae bacterium]
MGNRAPNCLKCEHFHVTWDPKFPRGCRVFGVKSPRMPSLVVFESTGRHCPAFSQAPRIKSVTGESDAVD